MDFNRISYKIGHLGLFLAFDADNRAVVLDAVHVAIEPIVQKGVPFGRGQHELLAAFLLHVDVEVGHEHATGDGDVHRFGNAVLRQLEFIVGMGQRIRVVPMELAPQVESRRLAQIQIQHGVRGIRAGDGNLVALGAQLFHAEHSLLVQVKAHPLVAALQDRLVHAVGVVFFDDMHVLQAKDFGGADNGRDVVRVKEILENHAEMARTAVHHLRQQFLATVGHTFQKGFQGFLVRHFNILVSSSFMGTGASCCFFRSF